MYYIFGFFFTFSDKEASENTVMSLKYFFKLDAFNFPSRYVSRDNLIHFQRANRNLYIAPSISLEA